MTHERRQGVLLRVVLGLSALSVMAMAFILVVGLPRILSTADTSAQVKRGNDLSSCRSIYNTRVTDARAAADDLVLRGLADLARNDQAALAELVTAHPPNLAPVDQARHDVMAANALYKLRVQQSRTHPAAFLAACATANP